MAHLLRERLDDGQPQAGVLAGAHLVCGVEPLEHPGQVLLSQLRRVVGEGRDQCLPLLIQPDVQGFGAVLQGVADEVGQDPGHRPRVGGDGRRTLHQLHRHLEPRLLEVLVKARQQGL